MCAGCFHTMVVHNKVLRSDANFVLGEDKYSIDDIIVVLEVFTFAVDVSITLGDDT